MYHDTSGAPYHEGDPICVNEQEGTILHVAPVIGLVSFGLRWMLTVRLHDGRGLMVDCDDDGRNHKVTTRVRPSNLVAA